MTKGRRPHLSEGLNDALKVFKCDGTTSAFVKQAEALFTFLLLGAIDHDINITQVLVEGDLAVAVLIHYSEHTVCHETKTVGTDEAEGHLVILQTHVLVNGFGLKSLGKLEDLVVMHLEIAS